MAALDQRARGRLDRERILDAAQAIADEEGIAKLTLRRIGAALGAALDWLVVSGADLPQAATVRAASAITAAPARLTRVMVLLRRR